MGISTKSVELTASNNYDYSAQVPEKLIKNGFLSYRIIVSTDNGSITFPGEVEGSPSNWDFHSRCELRNQDIKRSYSSFTF